jgi:two-component system LytT family response regulator
MIKTWRENLLKHKYLIDDFKVVASCASAIDAQSVLQNETIDLLFLDSVKPKIELPSKII